jgi:hypothetical protein
MRISDGLSIKCSFLLHFYISHCLQVKYLAIGWAICPLYILQFFMRPYEVWFAYCHRRSHDGHMARHQLSTHSLAKSVVCRLSLTLVNCGQTVTVYRWTHSYYGGLIGTPPPISQNPPLLLTSDDLEGSRPR